MLINLRIVSGGDRSIKLPFVSRRKADASRPIGGEGFELCGSMRVLDESTICGCDVRSVDEDIHSTPLGYGGIAARQVLYYHILRSRISRSHPCKIYPLACPF